MTFSKVYTKLLYCLSIKAIDLSFHQKWIVADNVYSLPCLQLANSQNLRLVQPFPSPVALCKKVVGYNLLICEILHINN